jgi:hypothetical protein
LFMATLSHRHFAREAISGVKAGQADSRTCDKVRQMPARKYRP